MMRSSLGIVVLLLTLACAGSAQEGLLPPELRTGIDKAVEETMAKAGLPSASIAVVKDGKLAYAKAYGLANVEAKTPATTEMRYAIGSISKQFTAAAMVMLAEEGKLSLDDKVSKYLPRLTRSKDITLRHLLTMTSGYQDYWPQDYLMPEMRQAVNVNQILAKWAAKPLDFEPGTKYQYSNTNYVIAGMIIEKVSETPYFEFLQKHIFTPLNMKSVVDINQGRLAETDPTGYERFALGPPRPATKEGAGWLFAAGGLAMTPSDLAKWNISYIQRRLMKLSSYKKMQTVMLTENGASTGYALGLSIGTTQGRLTVSHTGEVMGFVASNTIYPDDQIAVTVLTNQMTSGASAIDSRVSALLFPPDPAMRSSEDKVRRAFMGLQRGEIDRALFTENANDYFNATALKDFAVTLGPLGEPQEMNPGVRRLRGGFIIQSYRPVVGGRSLRISVFETKEGRFEQFLVEPAD
jgi:D-alanyl-D-alanine carboxypeptidase